MARFLHLMLICKCWHFAEILAATALAFLGAKMKGTFIRYGKNEEQEKVLDGLSNYEIGDVDYLSKNLAVYSFSSRT